MNDRILVRAITTVQDNKYPIYAFFLKGRDVLRIADISRIKKNTSGELLGYQRAEVQQHVNEIVSFLNSGSVLFPNAIILAMSSEVSFKRSRGPKIDGGDAEGGVLEIPVHDEGQKVAWIVDGQQRTLALAKSRNGDLLVPVTAFVSDDFEVHRTQFLLVNKVKPLPNGLINELLPAVNTTLPPTLAKNKIPSALCDILNKDPDSPFCGLIRRTTTDRAETKAVVKDNSVLQVIKNSLNSVHGCLYQYRNVATGQVDVESARKVINLYWGVVADLFPDAWGRDPSKSRLMGGVGIRSMGHLMDRIMSNTHPDESDARQRVAALLRPIQKHCAWTSGAWERLDGIPWNQLANTERDIKLLSNMLIRLYTGVQKA